MSTEQKNTMHQQAIYDAEAPQGRFALHEQHSKPVITGTAETAPGLVAPNWSAEAASLPDEEALGFEVDWLPSMETLSGLPKEPKEETQS